MIPFLLYVITLLIRAVVKSYTKREDTSITPQFYGVFCGVMPLLLFVNFSRYIHVAIDPTVYYSLHSTCCYIHSVIVLLLNRERDLFILFVPQVRTVLDTLIVDYAVPLSHHITARVAVPALLYCSQFFIVLRYGDWCY